MEDLIFLLTASLVLYKSPKKFRRLQIGDTGCSVHFFSIPVEFDFTETNEGDKMYFTEYEDKNIGYGILCAQLNESLTLEEAQHVMTNYLDRLHKPFNALYNTGIDYCKTWRQAENCVKLVDYWQDENGFDWKIKGYTDGKTIAVLYVKNINETPVEKQDLFLDSFSFYS